MAVIPTTVEFVHCEPNAIYSEDLLRCHTGSPLDQFVSQSHRYRRSSSSSSSSRAVFSNPRRAAAREMRLIRRCFLLLDCSFLRRKVALQPLLPLVRRSCRKRIRSSLELHEYINLTVDMCQHMVRRFVFIVKLVTFSFLIIIFA